MLLGQVWRQLLIDGNARGKLTARSTGISTRTTAYVAVASAYNVVADVVTGVDVDCTACLDNGGIALIAIGQLGNLAELGHLGFGGSDKFGHCRFKAADVVGVITAAGKPVLLSEFASGIGPGTGVAGTSAAEGTHSFSIAGLYAGVVQVVQCRGEVAAGGNGAALVEQIATADAQITASDNAGRCACSGHFQFFTLSNVPGMSCLAAAVVVVEFPVARTLYNHGGIDTAVAGSQNRTDVLYRARRQTHAAVALYRR
ncbi:hypothetical protein PSFL111601_13845 [Pseudomonas floridensis]